MESSLKRVFDYKLIFDSLCDSNGMLRLETLTARWPTSQLSDPESKVPHGCLEHWTKNADKDGYLDWSGFSTALQNALSEDASRVDRVSNIPRSKAEQKLAALRLKGAAGPSNPPLSKVTGADIESFLLECSKEVLSMALHRMRKEVYKGQLALHREVNSSQRRESIVVGTDADQQSVSSGPPSRSTSARGNQSSGGIVAREREELQYGLEMLEQTRKWYKDRLKLLATEESQNPSHSKTVKAEELLEVLERGTSSRNEMLQHLKEINVHLEHLSSPAPSLTAEQQSRLQSQLKKWSEARQEKSQSKPLSLPVGPPPAHVGNAVVEFSPEDETDAPDTPRTIIVNSPTIPTFPVAKPEELSGQRHSTLDRPTKRAMSTTEMHRLGVNTLPPSGKTTRYQAEGSRSHRTQPRYASSQNISINSRQTSYGADSQKPRSQRAPKRSHSFTSPTRTSRQEEQSEFTNSVTDYPTAAHRQPQQYPLRGSSSVQDLQSSRRSVSTDRPTMQNGQLSKSKSLSVRNVSTSNHGSHTHAASVAPGLIHQQVYNTGMSYSIQQLPTDRTSESHRGYHGNSLSRHTRKNKVTDYPEHPPQRLGDSIRSLV